jgi:hypothetical protein
MKEEFMIHMIEETCKMTAKMDPFAEGCEHLLPSYNALLKAAKARYPDDSFISVLPALDSSKRISPRELHILLTQLRIALESLYSEGNGREEEVAGTTEGKPSRLDDIENRLAEVNAQMQAVAEQMSQANQPPEAIQSLARDMSQLARRQTELSRERARVRER